MTLWQQWAHRPQGVWARKALFQVHLWMGVAVGLYVVAISLSGSAIVYRRELQTWRVPKRVISVGAGRISVQEMRQRIARAYPTYEVLAIVEPDRPDRADAVALEHDQTRIQRLFDPYTGADLGDPRSAFDRALGWLTDLHDNLLSGLTGRILNGLGALSVTLLGFTGAVVWWPGTKNWRRSMTINPRARFARLNWDAHSATGFWCAIFVLIWGMSGIVLCLPGTLNFLLNPESRYWLTRLHFGRFNGITEALWTILGFAPAVLAVSGALMWWNRVLSKKL